MAYVYILRSLVNGRYYIGSTNDLERRIKEHNSGQSSYTKLNRPFEICFYQEYALITEARKIESKLKKLKSRIIIEKIITNKRINLDA